MHLYQRTHPDCLPKDSLTTPAGEVGAAFAAQASFSFSANQLLLTVNREATGVRETQKEGETYTDR